MGIGRDMGVCESSESKQQKTYNQWITEVRESEKHGVTPQYRQAQEIAKEATETQLSAHEARRQANEAEDRARRLENRARMLIHAAAEATNSAMAASKPRASVTSDQLKTIVEAVKANSEQHIVLELFGQEDNLSPEDGSALAEALMYNTRVKTVNLANRMIGDGGTRMFCNMLKKNRTLQSLNLKSNNITDEGAFVIADMLQKNKTLTYLNVGNAPNRMVARNSNSISDHGLKVICQALERNCTLKRVVFNNLPEVSDFGARAVMQMVEVNTGLTDVYLEGKTGISTEQRTEMRKGNSSGMDEDNTLID